MGGRRRRLAEEARAEAIQIARLLLIEHGPAAITLKAVADRMGVAHGNIAHHFGSATGLQGELARAMLRDVVDAAERAIMPLHSGETDVCPVVDLVFDAFDRGGAGRLVAWLASSGHRDLLEPLCAEIARLASAIGNPAGDPSLESRRVGQLIALVVIPALGASLLGSELASALFLENNVYRSLAVANLIQMPFANQTQ